MKAIRVHRPGTLEVLLYEETSVGPLGADEVLVRNHAIGVNYTEVYTRNGAFTPSNLPFTPGKEAAGEMLAVGDGVTDFAPGASAAS